MGNAIKTTLLLGLMTGLFLVIGKTLGGNQGMVIAFGMAVIMNFGSYWFSDKIVLAMYRGREVAPDEAPELHAIVDRLCHNAGLPKPKVYVLPDDQPNAFATGRNPQHAAIAATQGIMRLLSTDELEGVLAHELAHVKHRDILISSVAATVAGAVMMLAQFARFAAIFGGGDRRDSRDGANPIVLLATVILAPIAASMIHMWISRTREFAADAGGAEISGKPHALANALRKIEAAAQRIPMENAAPATAHMFIINPLSGQSLAGLFSSHPPTAERVARLEAMAQSAEQAARAAEPLGDRDFRRFL